MALIAVTTVSGQETVDTAMMARIRAEGLDHSRVMEVFDHLVNVIGPRLRRRPRTRRRSIGAATGLPRWVLTMCIWSRGNSEEGGSSKN
jgi:carboxypeptidase Q